MNAKLAYAKTFGPAYGKAKAAKLHYSRDGQHTVCGMACYKPSEQEKPWTDVCGRCAKNVAEKTNER